MQLKILSQAEAKREVAIKPSFWNVISIAGPGTGGHPTFKTARDIIKLEFDDITDTRLNMPGFAEFVRENNLIVPDEKEIAAGLAFGRKYWDGPLLIHCFAGISRSTAMAWLILFDKFREVGFVTDYLFLTRFCALPNERIMRIGLRTLVPNKEQRLEIWTQIKAHPKWPREKDKEIFIK